MRYATLADFAAVAELDGANFGFHYSARDLEDALLDVDPTRFLVEEQGERLVGATTDIPFRMTVPDGGEVPVAGITWVSVEVAHRRTGVMRRLVERQLRDRAADGFAAAVLTASQGSIYERFGFGVAEYVVRTVLDRRGAALRGHARPGGRGSVERLTTAAALEMLPAIYERWRREVPGALDRNPRRWQFDLLDREQRRDGASGLFHLVHPDGYVSYRVAVGGDPAGDVVRLVDYAAITGEAHTALWHTLLAIESVVRIESTRIPCDDPLPGLLVEPRHVRTTDIRDGLWVRPLDVVALLSARTYAVEIDVVLEVPDPLFGGGRYRLQGGPDGARCTRVDREPDVRLGAAALGAVSLGGVRLVQLARTGRVSAAPDVLTRLDRALLDDRAPQHSTRF